MSVALGTLQPRKKSETPSGAHDVRQEPRIVRWIVIALAVLFLFLFLVLPLAAVFAQAFARGVDAYFNALLEPDALAAIRLTLLVAAIVVALNVRLRVP